MFWFMLIALVVVVGAVALAVLGNGGALPDAEPDRVRTPLPADRPVHPSDLDTLRFAVGWRGYRMEDVDDVLDRVGAELAEREARIAELESALAGAHDAALGGPGLTAQQFHPQHFQHHQPDPARRPQPGPQPEHPGGPHGYQQFPPQHQRPLPPRPGRTAPGGDEQWHGGQAGAGPWNGER